MPAVCAAPFRRALAASIAQPRVDRGQLKMSSPKNGGYGKLFCAQTCCYWRYGAPSLHQALQGCDAAITAVLRQSMLLHPTSIEEQVLETTAKDYRKTVWC
jgi:hypothetical protein